MWEFDIDAAYNDSVKKGVCPDCGEKINTNKCCASSTTEDLPK